MLMAVVSPAPLSVESGDFTLIGVGTHGPDHGKSIYINTRALSRHSKFYFEDGDYENTLKLLKSELDGTKSISKTLANWFENTSIMNLNRDSVEQFNEIYQISKDGDLIKALALIPFNDNTTLAEYIILNSLKDIIEVIEENEQNEEE